MGDFVILSALGSWLDLGWWSSVMMAALGLGAVIFVHELGHFAVAKWCGVRCDKFYLGFDIYGLKLFKYRWGETEYGIGILPLGGYVKMLGQDDNPSNQAEEAERAQTAGQIDPRSYLAKSVPQRMAIISAGVIMNIIFAFIFSVWAYSLGVTYTPSVIGNVVPGDPAWKRDIRPGDEAVTIGGVEKPRFDQDLMQKVVLANLDRGEEFVLQRPGEKDLITKVIKPEHNPLLKRPTVGLVSTSSLEVALPADRSKLPDSPFARAEPPFEEGDTIVRAAGVDVGTYADLAVQLIKHNREPIEIVVARTTKPAATGKPGAKPSRHEVAIKVDPQPTRRLGLVMEMQPIAAVQENSPAFHAKLKAGDKLISLDGAPVGDPLTLAERLRRLGAKSVKLGIQRGDESLTVDVALREATWSEMPQSARGPLSAPALGIAYGIGNTVVAVEPGSPAERAGIKPGAQITAAEIVYDGELAKQAEKMGSNKFLFTGEERKRWFWERRAAQLDPKRIDWPLFEAVIVQNLLPGAKVRLTTDADESFDLAPQPSTEWFEYRRGLLLEPLERTRTAESFGEAIALGARQTKEDVLLVYTFLQKLSSGQISPLLMRGVLTIGQVAFHRASAGFPQLLMFLAVLSANLAVVNFLPIPVLDGGHMVFLACEGLRGKPVSERVQLAFTWAGMFLILGLMVFVIGLDVGDLLSR